MSRQSLAPIRRIVTTHDFHGKAVFDTDEVLVPADPLSKTGEPPHLGSLNPAFTTIFRTDSVPASAQESWADPHGKMQNLVGGDGVVCRIVDFPPVVPGDKEEVNRVHRTDSVDYGIVLEGEIDLILDDGVEKRMGKGDVVVQRGTNHLWHNRSDVVCRMMFVLIPAKPIQIESTGQILNATDTSQLEGRE